MFTTGIPAAPDRSKRSLDLGAPLWAADLAVLGLEEALDADADSGGAPLAQHPQAVGGGRGRRGLHRHRDRPEPCAEHPLGDVEQPIQLAGVQKGRGAAADRRLHISRAVAQHVTYHRSLPAKRGQVGAWQLGGRERLGEQVAEAAAHLAERHMQVEEQRIAPLPTPDLPQRDRRPQRPVGGLVRVGIHVVPVRRSRRQLGHRRCAHHPHHSPGRRTSSA
jgi:hypothetical protein